MASYAAARAELSRLRRHIARIENRLFEEERLDVDAAGAAPSQEGPQLPARKGKARSGRERGRLPLGLPGLDAALGGGLSLGALHEVRAGESRDGAAAAGFVFAILSRLASAGGALPLLWVSVAGAVREAGQIYAPGLAALGIDPGRLVRVSVRRPDEALWVFEAALACRGLATAICELRGAVPDLTQSRRCALRARDHGVTGFLLGLGTPPAPTAAETRFRLAPAPAGTLDDFAAGIGRAAWRLSLEKNRNGRIGEFTLEWNAHERRFEERQGGLAAADSQPVAAAALHRPADPPRWPAEKWHRRAS